MAAIDDIIIWANSLPDWQADSIRRLLLTGEQSLNSQDYLEILALAKAYLKLELPPVNFVPISPVAGSFSGVPITKVCIKLISVDNVQNVNVIKPGQAQPFAEQGVTVIYGDNGSGKSGYSRILKQACQARDKSERILPDVFSKTPTGAPSATLKIKQDGVLKEIIWAQGTVSDPVLTNITVFDGRCARVITDDRNQSSYLPYGCDVFSKLADVVLKVKADIETEIISLPLVQDSAVVKGTQSAKFLEELLANTKDEDVHAATNWTIEDEAQLTTQEELARTSNATKAMQEVSRLEKIKGRLNAVINGVVKLTAIFPDLTNEGVQKVLLEVNTAQSAYAAAIAERKTPEVLDGVAITSQWEILYKAAKRYSEEIAYVGEPFPKMTDDSVCVLCQQPLDKEAIARFGRFKKFMEDETSTLLNSKRTELKLLNEKVNRALILDNALLESICDEIVSLNAEVAEDLRAYYTKVAARKVAILALLKEGEDPQNALLLPPWPASIETKLQLVVTLITQKAADISTSAKPEEYKNLLASIVELKSRKALSARKESIEEYIIKARRNAALYNAVGLLRTQEITRQGTALIKKNLTPELVRAFKDELIALEATRLPISWKTSGEEGETSHEMLLEGAKTIGGIRTSQVLSEGETRVIAIAGFLAELKLVPHANPIILDDPASSLDHLFTRKIAERLVREGLTRQVIIFTHNIGFLMELQDASLALARAGTPVGLEQHTLRRGGVWAGITTKGSPWHAKNVKGRLPYIEELAVKIKPLYIDNMQEYNKEAAYIYGLLRETWEACVENDLLDSVVCRYRNSVQTLKLIEVDIEDKDIHLIDHHMAKASTWMTGHDKSKALHENRPSPDELLVDIDALRVFSKELITRRSLTEKRRKELLQPRL